MFGIRTLFYQKNKETRFPYKKLIKSEETALEETYYDNQRKTKLRLLKIVCLF